MGYIFREKISNFVFYIETKSQNWHDLEDHSQSVMTVGSIEYQ
jgi:hypothetical protein